MGTATLKSILERIVDQRVNINKTENKPSHRKGDGITQEAKWKISLMALISKPAAGNALFLKQN